MSSTSTSVDLGSQEVEEQLCQRERLRARLEQLPHTPGQCPISGCQHVIFPCGLLVHFLHKHTLNPDTQLAEVYDQQSLRLNFDPRDYTQGANHCLAMLLYGGPDDQPESPPGCRFLMFPNAGLMHKRKRYENHLPIMVMICRSTWYAMLPDKQLEHDLVTLRGDDAGIFVIWLVAPITNRKFHYTLTVFDRYYLQSRSVIRQVRNFTHTQNPSDFLHKETNYLVLRDSEVANFLQDRRPGHVKANGIGMELIIHENLMAKQKEIPKQAKEKHKEKPKSASKQSENKQSDDPQSDNPPISLASKVLPPVPANSLCSSTELKAETGGE